MWFGEAIATGRWPGLLRTTGCQMGKHRRLLQSARRRTRSAICPSARSGTRLHCCLLPDAVAFRRGDVDGGANGPGREGRGAGRRLGRDAQPMAAGRADDRTDRPDTHRRACARARGPRAAARQPQAPRLSVAAGALVAVSALTYWFYGAFVMMGSGALVLPGARTRMRRCRTFSGPPSRACFCVRFLSASFCGISRRSPVSHGHCPLRWTMACSVVAPSA